MTADDGTQEADKGKFAVLDVFGLKLEVSNPRFAELLKMDAKDALTRDVRDLASAGAVREFREEAAEALPDVVLTPATAKDDHEATVRRQFRSRAASVGEALGFETRADGVWQSSTGVTILTRAIDRPVSLAAASHYVQEISARREQLAGADAAVLFIVDGQQSADVFKVAIRQRHLYHVMRVISLEHLEEVRGLMSSGAVDHAKAVILLAPVANIDVGEVLSVIRSAGEDEA